MASPAAPLAGRGGEGQAAVAALVLSWLLLSRLVLSNLFVAVILQNVDIKAIALQARRRAGSRSARGAALSRRARDYRLSPRGSGRGREKLLFNKVYYDYYYCYYLKRGARGSSPMSPGGLLPMARDWIL